MFSVDALKDSSFQAEGKNKLTLEKYDSTYLPPLLQSPLPSHHLSTYERIRHMVKH